MSVQLFNFCNYHDYIAQLAQTGKTLPEFARSLGLDGIEHLVYGKELPEPDYKESSVGVHLAYWPYWLGFWRQDTARLKRQFSTPAELENCYWGARTREEWLAAVAQNLRVAAELEPAYMVWHVSEADVQEVYTFAFQYSDREVLDAAAAVFNRVSGVIPPQVTVLFENLWWPGLRLTNPEDVRYFFERIERKNVGIMLDTGHLMNTNPDLQTEAEAADYVCRVVDNLGEMASYIQGVHLSCSLSGAYQKSFDRTYLPGTTFGELYKHIVRIDQHQPFRTRAARQILDFVQPKFVNHEMIYSSVAELEEKLKVQLGNC